MPRLRRLLVIVLAGVAAAAIGAQSPPAVTCLVIVVDGLRPDAVTETVMPRLWRLGRRGTVFTAHHAVYPTVTRVNGSSFVTGAYPEAHGLMGNTIYVPRANAARTLDTGVRENLEMVERAEGTLLTAPTLSDVLTTAGKKMLVVSSGSSGSAYLLQGSTIHYDFVRPPALAERVAAVLGAAPAAATPNDPRNRYALDAYLKIGLGELHPDVTFMWLNDPDGTAHANGLGVPITRDALRLIDNGIGQIEDALKARGLLDRTNIIVTSDHGFSTHTAQLKLNDLVQPFAKPMPDGTPDLMVAEGSIHFRAGWDAARAGTIVAALQKRPEVGAIFTRDGAVAGTLSLDTVRWNHPTRSGDILVSANWSSDVNASGVPGKTTSTGTAGHGSSGVYDIHNTLLAAGPAFREHAASSVPTGNVDIAPTLLRLMGLHIPPSMSGRVIEEGLRNGPLPGTIKVSKTRSTARRDGYELSAYFSTAAGKTYLDYTTVSRK